MRECRCIHNCAFQLFKKMREAGVEPARLAALDPKSSASANFATLASEPRHRRLALFVRYAVYRRSALPTNRLTGGDKAAKKKAFHSPCCSRSRSRLPEPWGSRGGHVAKSSSWSVSSEESLLSRANLISKV